MATKIKRYGWRPDLPDQRDRKFKAAPRILNKLPPKVDLRSKCPPVFDQGNLGSCTANATGAQTWFIDKTAPVVPSRLFIYYNTRILEGTVGEDSGASIRNSIKSVRRWGCAPEDLWPYAINKFKAKPPQKAYDAAKKQIVTEYRSVTPTGSQLKSALASGLPVNFGFAVYESFEYEQLAKTGIMPMPKKSESVLGGHAVLLVGYDDSKSRYVVRNSWGTNWGLAGYFYMPYAFVHNPNMTADFWVISAVT